MINYIFIQILFSVLRSAFCLRLDYAPVTANGSGLDSLFVKLNLNAILPP